MTPFPSPSYASELQTAVIGAYYARVIASADAARARAQTAYTVAASLSAVLLGAGIVSRFGTVSSAAKVLGAFAVALWALTASLYGRATSRSIDWPIVDTVTKDQLVALILDRVATEKRTVQSCLARANMAAVVAGTVTVLALVVDSLGESTANETVRLIPSAEGAEAIEEICGEYLGELTGEAVARSLSGDTIVLSPTSTTCQKRTRLYIPRSSVLVVAPEN